MYRGTNEFTIEVSSDNITWFQVVQSNLGEVPNYDYYSYDYTCQLPLEEFVPSSIMTGHLIRFTAKSCFGSGCRLQYLAWENVATTGKNILFAIQQGNLHNTIMSNRNSSTINYFNCSKLLVDYSKLHR